jgi:hypothetical protein
MMVDIMVFFSVKFRVVCLDGDLMPITNEMDITIIVSKLNNIQLWPSCNWEEVISRSSKGWRKLTLLKFDNDIYFSVLLNCTRSKKEINSY